MREDYMEALDKMFPLGYLIVWPNTEGGVRFDCWNPNRIEVIEDWKNQMIEDSRNGPEVNWKERSF